MHPNDGTGTSGHTVPRHVFVSQTGRWHERHPGILLDWRRTPDGWEAHVTWAAGGGNVAVTQYTAWVRAEHVRPVDKPEP